jgi:Na+-driven multidrug efflux pump
MAVAFAAAPVAGQNYGAKQGARVREAFTSAVIACCAIMFSMTLLCQWQGEAMIGIFTSDAAVIAVAAQFIHVISWNFFAMGIVFTCSSLFQALGNTWPALLSTGTRLVTFALPAIFLSRQPGFQLVHLWYLSVVPVLLQAARSFALLHSQFRRRLVFAP